jgi:hypothetical protein
MPALNPAAETGYSEETVQQDQLVSSRFTQVNSGREAHTSTGSSTNARALSLCADAEQLRDRISQDVARLRGLVHALEALPLSDDVTDWLDFVGTDSGMAADNIADLHRHIRDVAATLEREERDQRNARGSDAKA